MAKRTGFLRGNTAGPAPDAMYAGGVGTLPQSEGNVFAPPGTFPRLGLDLSKPHTWAWLYFTAAVFYLFFIYAAHGGRRGGVI